MPTFMGWGGSAITTAGWGGSGAAAQPSFLKKPRIADSLDLAPTIVDSRRADLAPQISSSASLSPKITDSEGDC